MCWWASWFFAVGAVAKVGDFQHTAPLAIATIALACFFVLAVFFLWIALLLAAYSIAFAILYRDPCLRQDPPAFAPPPAPLHAGT